MIEKMWPVKEACKRLGISERLIYKYFLEGRIIRTKIGKKTLVRDSELEKLIQDQPRRKSDHEDVGDLSREERAGKLVIASKRAVHSSDCATSIAPAEEPGLCDCDEGSSVVTCPNCGWYKCERASVHVETLTPKRLAVLSAIAAHIQQYKCPPSLNEIAKHLGYTSLATVHKHVSNLQRGKFLTRYFNRNRAMELTSKGEFAVSHYCPPQQETSE